MTIIRIYLAGICALGFATAVNGQSIQKRSNASEVKSIALANGMKLLRVDGMEKIDAGLTTLNEVDRVSMIAVDDSQ